jgi:uncharacterized membrane protein YfcA
MFPAWEHTGGVILTDWLQLAILVAAGTAAGFFNVVAGGGSLLTMPALILMGFPSAVANGTNRLAVLGQSITSILTFRMKGYSGLRIALMLSVPACAGAAAGTLVALAVSDELFHKLLSGIMLLATATLFVRRPSQAVEDRQAPRAMPLQMALFAVIGFYGGFIQAGVGFLIMAALAGLGRLRLVRTNSIKVFVVGAYTLPSLALFILNDKVAWLPAIVLTGGHALGGWLGTLFTVSRGEKWIRIVLALSVAAMALKLAGCF